MTSEPESPLESGTPIRALYEQLHNQCGTIVGFSLEVGNLRKISFSHQVVSEIETWCEALEPRKEASLLRMADQEYQYALLALTQGHYRQAFKALRLVLELTLQAVYLSTNEIDLREWLNNQKDTTWGTLVEEQNGIFSKRFSNAFFPELHNHMAYHRSLACQVYRECSECVHGNVPFKIPLPGNLEFSQETFDLWHAKASIVALLVNFVISSRYLKDISRDSLESLENILVDRLGHIQEIRTVLGGPTGG